MTYVQPSRESISTAIMTLLQGLLTTATPTPGMFVTVSRRVQLWYNMAPELKPALFLQEPEEVGMPTPIGTPRKAEWVVHLIMYAECPLGGSAIGGTLVNQMLDAVEQQLGLQAGNGAPQTLAGTVYRLWQEGTIRKDPGDIDGHALAVYPLRIRPP